MISSFKSKPAVIRPRLRRSVGHRGVRSESARQVAEANAAARLQPSRAGFLGAMQMYPYSDGALFQVYAAPGEVTDIALEPGESLAGSGPVAAGDTVRWIIGDTASGSGETRRVHILVKPTAPDLSTNLVINTDRRTYHLELATAATYMAEVSFRYPRDALIAIRAPASGSAGSGPEKDIASAGSTAALNIDALNFRYRITGDKPSWRPLRAFDDGRRVYIQFPPNVSTGEMPPLWVTGADHKPELVNYRVQGAHLVVDRLFTAAELRLGGKHQVRVRIVRDDRAPA